MSARHRDRARRRQRMQNSIHRRRNTDEIDDEAVQVVHVDDDTETNALNGSCIDLTGDDGVEVVELVNSNDSPVVVLTNIDDIPRNRRSRRRGRGRQRHVSEVEVIHSTVENQVIAGAINVDDEDSSEDDLPEITLPGTPFRPEQSPGAEAQFNSPASIKVTCPVCMDDDKQIRRSGRNLMSTTCGHVFCSSCIRNSVQHQRSCPTCRKRLTVRQIHPLYL